MDIRSATPEQRVELNKLILGALNTDHRKRKLNNAAILEMWGLEVGKYGESDYDPRHKGFYVRNPQNGRKICMNYENILCGTNECRLNALAHGNRGAWAKHWTSLIFAWDVRAEKFDYVGYLTTAHTGEHTMNWSDTFNGGEWQYSPKYYQDNYRETPWWMQNPKHSKMKSLLAERRELNDKIPNLERSIELIEATIAEQMAKLNEKKTELEMLKNGSDEAHANIEAQIKTLMMEARGKAI